MVRQTRLWQISSQTLFQRSIVTQAKVTVNNENKHEQQQQQDTRDDYKSSQNSSSPGPPRRPLTRQFTHQVPPLEYIDLYIKNDWVINHKSFSTRQPSEYTIQSFKKSFVYELTIDSVHKLISKSQAFLTMGKILEESTSRINFFDNNNTPDEKYDFIINNKPQLLQEFPQKIIASYLKITPETLSRVRKRLSEN